MADSPFQSTAYSRVARKFAEFLMSNYNVFYISIQPIGMTFAYNGYTVISGTVSQIRHDLGNKKFAHGIYIRNSWVFSQTGDARVNELKKLTDDVVVYSPVEEQFLPDRYFQGYGVMYDRLWTMTKWGQSVIKNSGYESDVLYHFFDKA